jgi:signal transduction histidine kinase
MADRTFPSSPDSAGTCTSAQVSLGDLCTWEFDFKTNRVRWSDQLCELLGITVQEIPQTLDGFLKFVHPDDHHTIRAELSSLAGGKPFEGHLHFLPASGGAVTVHSRSVPISDRSGQVVAAIGFCRQLPGASHHHDRDAHRELLLTQAEQVANFGRWEFNLDSRLGSISTHLAHMLGIASGSIISEQDYWEKVHPDDRSRVFEVASSAIAQNQPFQYVARYILQGGAIRHHFVRGLPVTRTDGTVESIIGIILDFSEQTHAEGELHRLSQQLLRTRDEERRNIARELHESTGQTLAALKMSLGRVREALEEDDTVVHNLLESAVSLADDAVREVRTLSYLMHPPLLDEAGLSSALRWYAKGFAERSGILVNVDVPQDFGRHGREVETTVFRIVQEALTNVHRYSGSRTATIRLLLDEGHVRAEVHDDGCGLPLPGSPTGRNVSIGVGIVGMRERVKQLNGTFEIESSPGKGTSVRVLLPVGLPMSGNARKIPEH